MVLKFLVFVLEFGVPPFHFCHISPFLILLTDLPSPDAISLITFLPAAFLSFNCLPQFSVVVDDRTGIYSVAAFIGVPYKIEFCI